MSKYVGLSVTAIVLALTAVPAYAYIDPGSGSMILQGLLAALAAIALTAKLWWHRLLVLVHIRKRTMPAPTDGAARGLPQTRNKDA